MKIYVTAKPKKKSDYIKQIDSTSYVVAVKEPAQQGRANSAIINALAEYFNVSKTQIIMKSGESTKFKVFEIPNHLTNFEPFLKQRKLL